METSSIMAYINGANFTEGRDVKTLDSRFIHHGFAR